MDPYDSDDEPIDFSKCRKKCRKTGLRGLYTEEEVEYLFEEEPLPILPLEIMNKILYEFGGLEHPLTKLYKEVKSSLPKVKRRTRIHECDTDREEHIWFKKHFNLKNNIYSYNDGDYTEYTKSQIVRIFRGGLIFCFQIKPLEQTGIIIKPYKLVRHTELYCLITKEQEYKKKDLQDYLEVNKIKWYKSWTKKRLMKETMCF